MKYLIVITFLFFYTSPVVAVTLKSQFGFSATLPDGWFLLSPVQLDESVKDQNPKSLGIPPNVDTQILNKLLEKVKGGDIEFYYDENYIKFENKNHFSVQIGEPIFYTSMEEVEQDCADMPAQLRQLYGEDVQILVCVLKQSSGRPYFHLVYKIPSLNMTILHNLVFVNKRYSIEVVGASANGIDGLKRLITAQQQMVDSVSAHLAEGLSDN